MLKYLNHSQPFSTHLCALVHISWPWKGIWSSIPNTLGALHGDAVWDEILSPGESSRSQAVPIFLQCEISQGRHVATSNTSPAQVAQKTWQPLNPRILGLECHPNLSCASSFISFFNSVLCFTMKQCLRWEYPASKDGVASRNICHPQSYNLQKWLLGGLTWNTPKKIARQWGSFGILGEIISNLRPNMGFLSHWWRLMASTCRTSCFGPCCMALSRHPLPLLPPRSLSWCLRVQTRVQTRKAVARDPKWRQPTVMFWRILRFFGGELDQYFETTEINCEPQMISAILRT